MTTKHRSRRHKIYEEYEEFVDDWIEKNKDKPVDQIIGPPSLMPGLELHEIIGRRLAPMFAGGNLPSCQHVLAMLFDECHGENERDIAFDPVWPWIGKVNQYIEKVLIDNDLDTMGRFAEADIDALFTKKFSKPFIPRLKEAQRIFKEMIEHQKKTRSELVTRHPSEIMAPSEMFIREWGE